MPWDQEIKEKIEPSDIAILLVSSRYLHSDYIVNKEIPLLKQRAEQHMHIFPVFLTPVFVAPDSSKMELYRWIMQWQGRPRDGKNLTEHYEMVCPGCEVLIYTEIARDLYSIISEIRRPRSGAAVPYEIFPTAVPAPKIFTTEPASNPRNAFVVYDWEDRDDVSRFVRQLRNMGVEIQWDQDWDCWLNYEEQARQRIKDSDLILVYSTSNTKHSSLILSDLYEAREAQKPIFVLDVHKDQRNEVLLNKPGYEISFPFLQATLDKLINQLNLQITPPVLSHGPLRNVKQLLQEALKANRFIPSDTLTDRIFLSPKVFQLVEEAYRTAERLPRNDPRHIRAVLEFARLCRFRGAWNEAYEILFRYLHVVPKNDPSLCAAYLLEYGSLVFERGNISGGLREVQEAYNILKERAIDEQLIKTLRQLGNMLAEQKGGAEPLEKLDAAVAIAEHLSERDKDKALKLLWIDCIRERASLLLRREKIDESLKQFESALEAVQDSDLREEGEHLEGVILYHLGRAYHLYKRDDRTANTYLQKSLRILRKYDNPLRLAFVYDHLGQVLTEQHPRRDFQDALEHIEKAKRIREKSGHVYTAGKTEMSLGHYHRHIGNLQDAIDAYERARNIFARLTKEAALGEAYLALGTTYRQLGNNQRASEYLEWAQQQYEKANIEPKVREVRYELLCLQFPGHFKLSLDSLQEHFAARGYTLLLTEVGEYRFHEWIKETALGGRLRPGNTRRISLDGGLEILVKVDIGDDAASLQVTPNLNGYEIVLTSDAAPGSICHSSDPKMGRYAGKFSVVHSISDIIAMGATPVALLLNMYLEREASVKYAMEVVKAVLDEARSYNVLLVGGDLKERREQSIGCVGIGIVQQDQAIKRTGARIGQIVAISLGRIPGTKEIRKIGRRWAQEIIEQFKLSDIPPYNQYYRKNDKEALLFTPVREMIAGAKTGLIRSAIDTSDGVLACLKLLGRSAEGNPVGFDLKEDWVNAVIDDEVKNIAFELGYEPAQFLFNAGHDWEIVLTVAPNDFESVRAAFQGAGGDLARLGVVCRRTTALADGIAFSRSDGRKVWIPFFTDEKFVRSSYEHRALEWEDLKFYLEGGRELTDSYEFRRN